MSEFKKGTLNSGTKKGPKVTNRKQAIAIMLSERRREAQAGALEKAKKRGK